MFCTSCFSFEVWLCHSMSQDCIQDFFLGEGGGEGNLMDDLLCTCLYMHRCQAYTSFSSGPVSQM